MASVSNKFLVQTPRIYHVFRRKGEVQSFGHFLSNIFQPLWMVSLNSTADPELHNFLQHISGFDSVDNEAQLDMNTMPSAEISAIYPHKWTFEENPPYWYWMYYMHLNIRLLNRYRESKGQATFSFRPHCGEAGSPFHLIDGFLLSSGISHGIKLRENAPLQYLYYLSQIGIAVSPLSNNSLWLRYSKNPFPDFFRRGLLVSLSTDDPLVFHHTSEPLIEEYAMASKIYHLTSTDTCEIAKHSVLTSGFSDSLKRQWLGDGFFIRSSLGNDVTKSHVPDTRCAFRFETYHDEIRYLNGLSTSSISEGRGGRSFPLGMLDILQERQLYEIIQNLRRSNEPMNKL
uniref:AMP deaminase n=1 Tax=Paramoeba aestuarina TaxID=180227 RepID=A0A7S4KED6_9EUKA